MYAFFCLLALYYLIWCNNNINFLKKALQVGKFIADQITTSSNTINVIAIQCDITQKWAEGSGSTTELM